MTPQDRALLCKRGALVDASGTGVGVNDGVLAENINRRYLLIQNRSDTVMYVDFGTAATEDTGIALQESEGIVYESGFVPTGSVNILAAEGKKYVIKEG